MKFFSEMPGSTHTLDVYVATGWQFVEGPGLFSNPNGLWTKTGSTTFEVTNLDDNIGELDDGAGLAEHEAKVDGRIRKINGSGGGGSSSAIDVSVTMLTRYFSMNFDEPLDNDKEFLQEEEEDIPVKVLLVNASGEPPETATVDFTLDNNAATLQESTTYNNGSAENLLTVTGDAGDTFTITAEADNVDITGSRTASGENEKSVNKRLPLASDISNQKSAIRSPLAYSELRSSDLHCWSPEGGKAQR
ncbi:MAG: hypothetical protein ACLFO5_05690 [Opitutales bacterium]